METAARDASELQHQRRQEVDVHKMGTAITKPVPVTTARKPCHRCTGFHDPIFCRFKDAVCHGCSRRGHIKVACRSTPTTTTTTTPSRGFYRFRGRNDRNDGWNRSNDLHAIDNDDCVDDECDDMIGASDFPGYPGTRVPG